MVSPLVSGTGSGGRGLGVRPWGRAELRAGALGAGGCDGGGVRGLPGSGRGAGGGGSGSRSSRRGEWGGPAEAFPGGFG